ncbi:radical SAM protein [Salmonella enterica subsp. enterica]|nr:radical SAM protein [Salmonella enterica subsp. enterica]
MNFINVIKPTHLCNLACRYCYNEDERNPIMTLITLEKVIKETFDYVETVGGFTGVEFIWHGGEPFFVGIDFYNYVVLYQKKHNKGINYINTIQTNGTLINNKWIKFIKDNDFIISLSIDGDKNSHDLNRIYKNGKGSFDKVMKGAKKLKQNGINFGSVLVVNKINQNDVEELYRFFVKEQIVFNIIPLVKSGRANDNFQDLGLDADEYFEPWRKVYDLWFDANDKEYIQVSDFVRKTQSIIAGRAADCIGMSQCGNANCSTDPLGDIYPCASLSGHNDLKYGNINQHTLYELFNIPVAYNWRNRPINQDCSVCQWQHVCHGGCQSRSYKFYAGDYRTKDYYCPSLKKMYEHIKNRLLERDIISATPYTNHMDDGLGETKAYLRDYLSLDKVRNRIPVIQLY